MTPDYPAPVRSTLAPLDLGPGRILVHPCCGDDLAAPLKGFAGQVETFVFIDARRVPSWRREEAESGLLPGHPGYHRLSGSRREGDPASPGTPPLVASEIQGEPRYDSGFLEAHACVRDERFRNDEGREVRVLRKRGCGLTTLRSLVALDILYYTGDSSGESGSNLPILWDADLHWLDQLRPGGRIVTDGSNSRPGTFGNDGRRAGTSFVRWGKCFTAVEELGLKLGRPVLAWEVQPEG